MARAVADYPEVEDEPCKKLNGQTNHQVIEIRYSANYAPDLTTAVKKEVSSLR